MASSPPSDSSHVAVCSDSSVEMPPRTPSDMFSLAVTAIGVSGMGPCVLLTDERGEPVRPAILYGVDTRAFQEIEDLTEQIDAYIHWYNHERIQERLEGLTPMQYRCQALGATALATL